MNLLEYFCKTIIFQRIFVYQQIISIRVWCKNKNINAIEFYFLNKPKIRYIFHDIIAQIFSLILLFKIMIKPGEMYKNIRKTLIPKNVVILSVPPLIIFKFCCYFVNFRYMSVLSVRLYYLWSNVLTCVRLFLKANYLRSIKYRKLQLYEI